MTLTTVSKKELLENILKECITNTEDHCSPEEKLEYYKYLGTHLAHFYRGFHRLPGERIDVLTSLKECCSSIDDNAHPIAMGDDRYYIRLRTSVTGRLFQNQVHCRVFYAYLIGTLIVPESGACTVRTRYEKKIETIYLAISRGQAEEAPDDGTYTIRRQHRGLPDQKTIIADLLALHLSRKTERSDAENDSACRLVSALIGLILEIKNERAGERVHSLEMNLKRHKEEIERKRAQRTLENRHLQDAIDAIQAVMDSHTEAINRIEKSLKTTAAVDMVHRNERTTDIPAPGDSAELDDYHRSLIKHCERLELENRILKHSTFVDEVTGSFNARYLMRRLEEELNRVRRHKRILSLIKIGIDNLHNLAEVDRDAERQALVDITNTMRKNLRNIDIITKTSDDEFVIMLPETALENALQVAQRIAESLRDLPLGKEAENVIHIGVSGSVLCFDNYKIPGSDLIKAAEQILQGGKPSIACVKQHDLNRLPALSIN